MGGEEGCLAPTVDKEAEVMAASLEVGATAVEGREVVALAAVEMAAAAPEVVELGVGALVEGALAEAGLAKVVTEVAATVEVVPATAAVGGRGSRGTRTAGHQ